MVIPTAFSKLEQEGGWLHGSGKRKHIDAGGAASLQNAGASIRRGSGGDHVVDDDDTLAEKLSARAQHPEGAGDVPPPLRRREPDLARRALDAREQEIVDGDAAEPWTRRAPTWPIG